MNFYVHLWSQIDRIQQALFLDDDNMARLFELSRADFKKARQSKQCFPLKNLHSFTQRLSVSLDKLIEGNIDLIQIQSLFLGKITELPRRYNYGKLSKSRTLINCLDYIDLRLGARVKNSLLKSLQIDPRFFNCPNKSMNINVLTDLCEQLIQLGFSQSEFKSLGKRSYATNSNTELGQQLRSHSTIEELFEDICSNQSVKFDQNFNYKISKVERNAIYIQSQPTDIAMDLMKLKNIGNKTICHTKLGVFSTFPRYLGYENTDAIKTKCIYSGDSCLEYKVVF